MTASFSERIDAFRIARLPDIRFGAGNIELLPGLIADYGKSVLVVTGRRSFVATSHWRALVAALEAQGANWHHVTVEGEPSPQRVDAIVAEQQAHAIDVVVAIGGGSVLDAAKAVAGLLRPGNSVMDHLEGVGSGLPYRGPAVPLIAVPTTAGTGSEATKNAVLSVQGADGFKKSFRDERLVAAVALVDPQLLAGCPKAQIAANGMDAFTQLLESYVSLNASPATDALAWSGMQAFCRGFWSAWQANHPEAEQGYEQIAYASLMSGITLAQAGLGSVHGLASPLGAFFPIPHGTVCGTLVAEATEVNVAALRQREPHAAALAKYAEAGRLVSGECELSDSDACDALVATLREWTQRLDMPRLGAYGMQRDDIERVVAGARGGSMKTNPLVLTDAELGSLLERRL
ncbi:iron-containing alcohol dehydrogenase [Halomonas sp. MCCC 1A11062]|uniref:iron-containing alcohol dehydrogenase n=1 Tax=Halomonas sp. MCCC 1A11062 TaxID=2733485 RepID=UPI001F35770D|nr:iron-containing alcohol dehydrogenase [Halomonas sp. MCCC 1A11062]MCE8036982.1 iron-containing alcohol dehydrogenase [Halomonas sp. MCCC 1A11062]